MSGFDFLDDVEDSERAPEAEAETPKELEEAQADDSSEEGAQEEPTTQEDDEAEELGEEFEVVEIDGQEITLDQIRELQKSGMREQDYTKKTQAVAEQRKALEAQQSKLDQAIDDLALIEGDIKGLLVADLDEIDLKALRESDYVEYQKVLEDKKERLAAFDKAKAKIEERKKESTAQRSQELADLMGWSDSGKRDDDIKRFQSLSKDAGFTEDDVKTITSPRVMAALLELSAIKSKPKPEAKAKAKKVKISKRSTAKAPAKKPVTLEDEINNFFN